MKNILCLAGLLLSAISCAPIPHTTIVSPEIKGRVIDATTGKPLGDVQITYTRGDYSATTTSEEDGTFSVGPLNQWHYLLFIGSPGHLPAPDWYRYFDTPATVKADNALYHSRIVLIDINCGVITPDGIKKPATDYRYSDNILVRVDKSKSNTNAK